MEDILNTIKELDEDTQKDKYLTFLIGDEEYGLEIKYVTEIIGLQNITEVPQMPNYVKGIINLRGKIIPVLDVRLRFNKEEKEYNDRTCIVVIDINEISVGLIVDTVSEVVTIPVEQIVPPPQLIQKDHHQYMKGIGKTDSSVKLILDCDKLILDQEMEYIDNLG